MYSCFVACIVAFIYVNTVSAQEESCTADGSPCTPVSLFQEKTLLSRNHLGSRATGSAEVALEVETAAESKDGYDLWDFMDPDRYSVSNIIFKLKKKGPPEQLEFMNETQIQELLDKLQEIKEKKEPGGATEQDGRMLFPALAAHITIPRALEILRLSKVGGIDFGAVTRYIFQAIDKDVTYDVINATQMAFDKAVSPMTDINEFEGVLDQAMGYDFKGRDDLKEAKPELAAMVQEVKDGKRDFEMLKMLVMAAKVMRWPEAKKLMKKIEDGEEDIARVEIYIHEALEKGTSYGEIYHKHHKKKDPEHSKWGPTIITVTIVAGALFLLYLMMYRKL
eukprot:gnl/TRDRNA2_/TRDRNA2_165847_c0_seq1.p1 gnl/TRDRNA2_/TRDRNA2_165847_c0~~gnl/TRDRNA2_/TRDRNA2_165847_c0_seq1.p1  ORF type:complete len:336 (+),score=83.69 gnl/TRDRNA2_/TRDRNA2_165847_c0_seq1:79-1086(+)